MVAAPEAVLLESLIKEVRQRAEEEARRILESAKLEAQRILDEARRQYASLRRQALEEARRRARMKFARELEALRLKLRAELLRRRYELLRQLLESSLEEAVALRERDPDRYSEALVRLAVEAISALEGDDFVIVPAEPDRELLGKLLDRIAKEAAKAKGRDVRVRLSDHAVRSRGGLIVQSADGRRIYNNTLEARVAMIEANFAPKLLRLLIGGPPAAAGAA